MVLQKALSGEYSKFMCWKKMDVHGGCWRVGQKDNTKDSLVGR